MKLIAQAVGVLVLMGDVGVPVDARDVPVAIWVAANVAVALVLATVDVRVALGGTPCVDVDVAAAVEAEVALACTVLVGRA